MIEALLALILVLAVLSARTYAALRAPRIDAQETRLDRAPALLASIAPRQLGQRIASAARRANDAARRANDDWTSLLLSGAMTRGPLAGVGAVGMVHRAQPSLGGASVIVSVESGTTYARTTDGALITSGTNGTADHTVMQAAVDFIRDANADGRGTLQIKRGTYDYPANGGIEVNTSVSVHNETGAIHRVGPDNAHATRCWRFNGLVATAYAFSGTLTKGTRAFVTDSTPTDISAGDTILLRLGTDPYDTNEEYTRMFARVESVTGNTVTLYESLPEDVSGTTHTLSSLTSYPKNIQLLGFHFNHKDGAAAPGICIQLRHCQGVIIDTIWADRNSAAIVSIQESEGVDIGLIGTNYAPKTFNEGGRVLEGWGFRNVTVGTLICRNADGIPLYVESQARGLHIGTLQLHDGANAGTTLAGVWIGGGSQDIHIENFVCSASVSRAAVSIYELSGVTIGNANITNAVKTFPTYIVQNSLRVGGTIYPRVRTYSRTISLKPSIANEDVTDVPEGIWRKVRVYSSGLTGLLGFKIATTATNTQYVAALVAGSTVDLGTYSSNHERLGSDYPLNNLDAKFLKWATDGTATGTDYLTVEIEAFVQDDEDQTDARTSRHDVVHHHIISESRTGEGITIDGCLIQDGAAADALTVAGRTPGAASGVATLDGSSKVVEDPANATATPTASKIPISGSDGRLAAGWKPYQTITSKATADSPYTAVDADDVVLCNATAGVMTINLPTAVGIAGKIYNVKKTDSSANAVTIDGSTTETIDGATTQALAAQYDNLTICSDGTNWVIL